MELKTITFKTYKDIKDNPICENTEGYCIFMGSICGIPCCQFAGWQAYLVDDSGFYPHAMCPIHGNKKVW